MDCILSVTWLRCAKPAKRIDVVFDAETPGVTRHVVFDDNLDTSAAKKFDAAFAKLLRPLFLLI